MDDPGSRSFRCKALWLLLAASFLVALPALRGAILSYDDANLLLGPQGALQRGVGSFFSGTYYYAYLPFYGLSYWIDGKLGAGPGHTLLFHLENVLWHAAASYLLFRLLAILIRNRVAALCGALLFALHPLHVESLAWIAGRKEVMSGGFFFLAWLLHLRSERGGGGATALALLAFLVACFTKSSAVVLPAVLLSAALLLPRYDGRRRAAALATLPFFFAAILPVAVHLAVGVEKGVVSAPGAVGPRFLYAVAGWGGMVQRALVPLGLSIDYPEVRAASAGGVVLPALMLLATLALLVWALRRRSLLPAFGILAFFVALAPFNDVFPATQVLAADRYCYLPLLGLAFCGAWAVDRWGHNATVAGSIVLIVLAVLACMSAGRFADDETLWTRTIAARDDSALAYLNRGITRVNRARTATPRDRKLLAAGVADLRRGLVRAVLPEHKAKALRALVIPLAELGHGREAIERAGDALRIARTLVGPGARRFLAGVLYDRGAIYKEALKDHVAAARDFHASAQMWSRYPALIEAGDAYLRSGDLEAAKRDLERAGEVDRKRPEPFLDLAKLYRALGKREERRRALEEARSRAPADVAVARAFVNFWLDAEAPDYLKAQGALDALPNGSPARRRLAAAVEGQKALFLFRRGRTREAQEAADHARAKGLRGSEALYELGQIYLEAGRYDDAVACYRGASDILSQPAAYRDAIGRAYALKSYGELVAGNRDEARRAMRAALDAHPEVIEAGAAPLRGEIEFLRDCKGGDLPLLAAVAVAGDPGRGERIAARLLDAGPAPAEADLIHRLRALLRTFTPPANFKGAEEDMEVVLQHAPKEPWARYRAAQILVLEGVGWLATGNRLDTERLRERGQKLLRRGIARLTKLLQSDPGFSFARLQRGEARFALDDLSGAKADYQALRDRNVVLKEGVLKEAVLHRLIYVRAGDATNLDIAVGLLKKALAKDPNYFDALFELGNVYHLRYDRTGSGSGARKRAFNQAVFWYRRAMALNPRRSEPRLEWARICLKAVREALAAGRTKACHELLERLEAEAADVAAVHKERLRLCLRPEFGKATGLGQKAIFDLARKALASAERLDPKDPELPALRALFHRRLGFSYYWRWAQLQKRPGREALRKRARELAIGEWKKAIGAWPEDPENQALRDRLRELAPEVVIYDKEEAKEDFRKGREAFNAHRWKEAARCFGEAVALFPESTDLRFSYASALARAGDLDRAREQFEQVANGEDGDRFPSALFELGNIYAVRRQPLVARVWFERFLRTMKRLKKDADPTVGEARRRLAEISAGKK